jgi:spoIIIJ-associated protein
VTSTNTDNSPLVERALGHLHGLLAAAQLDAVAEVESRDGDNVTLAVTGPDARLLLGPQAQALDALQYLLSLMTNKSYDQRLRITLDADGYRARRTQTLTTFAHDMASQVAASGQEAITDPLNAMERRIIHTALVEHPEVQTYSEGDDPNRYVVISPRPPAQS